MPDLSSHISGTTVPTSIEQRGGSFPSAVRLPRIPRHTHAQGKRLSLLPLVTLSLVTVILCACTGQVTASSTRGLAPVYSVATLRAHLAVEPQTWVGRIVRVRAVAEPCPVWGSPHSPVHCTAIHPDLVDPDGIDLADPLPLVLKTENPLLTTIRQLPLIGQLIAPSPVLPWEVLRTYRVQLRAVTTSRCDSAVCFEAVLLP